MPRLCYARKNKYFRRSHLREAKFRALIRYFAHDLRAWKIAELSGVSHPTINQLFMKLRIRIAQVCNASSPLSGEGEVDESYVGARRVRGKAEGHGAVNRSSSESWNATGKCRIQEAATERDLGSGSPGQHHPLGRLERLQWAGGHGLQKAVVVIFEVIG